MIPLDQAFAILLNAAVPVPGEQVPVVRAAGRIAAEPVKAPWPVPVAPRVMMDGFACRATDLAGAAPGRPARMRLAGRRWAGVDAGPGPGPAGSGEGAGDEPAGPVAGQEVGAGQAWQVSTGALLPRGADVVVPIEQACRAGEFVEVATWLPAGRHVAPPGEDVLPGQLLVAEGERITPRLAGLLAAAGVGWVKVRRRPRVLLFATGDELVPAGRWSPPAQPAAVPNSNLLTLAAALESLGFLVEAAGILPDEPAALRAALERAVAAGADVVITTGGVSVGPRDRVARAWLDLGCRRVLGRIDLKPGGPFFAGRLGPVWAVGLPGSPAACLAVFEVLVRPFLLRLAGQRAIARPVVGVQLAGPWPRGSDRTRVLWARLDRAAETVEPLVPARGRLVGVGQANALLYRRAGQPVPEPGNWVEALDLEAPEDRCWPDWFLASRDHRARPASAGGRDHRAWPGSAGGRDRPQALAPAAGPVAPALPPVVAVTGRSGSGKTQAAAGLIALLAARGLRVLAVKHAAHGFALDVPGSDSQRLAEAGAAAVALVGPGEAALRLLGLEGTGPGCTVTGPDVEAGPAGGAGQPAPGTATPGGPAGAAPGWTRWIARLVAAYRQLAGELPDLVLVEGGAGAGWPEIVTGDPKTEPAGEVITRLPPGFGSAELVAAAAALERWLATCAPALPLGRAAPALPSGTAATALPPGAGVAGPRSGAQDGTERVGTASGNGTGPVGPREGRDGHGGGA
ncbi:hypothetical protein DYI95_007310 [Thermaerobacter sp. PB12/4term]|nr:hypothetical protein DYI95_007310 [Thermaerobacter sp. PB12/4term]